MNIKSDLSALCLALAIAGCGGPEAPRLAQAGPAQIPSGFTLNENKKYGVSFAAPPNYRVGEPPLMGMGSEMPAGMTDPNNPLGQMMEGMEQESKEAELEEEAEREGRGIIIRLNNWDVKPIPGEARPHISLKKRDNEYSSLDEAVSAMKKGRPGDVTVEKVQLPIGPAVRMVTQFKSRGGDEVKEIDYIVLDGKDAYYLHFNATNNAAEIDRMSAEVAPTLRISPPSG
jgi:hypothetical protein